ncbi:MAG: TonB C-terminal domain-containing protein [Azoarcus sp.]|jgi:colicin import membrane protein|nr:TonB C-terminal domain-containing protein [Azoarcus sp.]
MKDFRMDRRPTNVRPRKFLSLILTLAVHIGLLAFLFFGIDWQSQPLGSLEVGLVGPGPAPVRQAPPPPPPEPPRPEPPKPEPPKPVVEESVPQPAPQIATKKEKPKEPPKPEKAKEKPKPRELKPINMIDVDNNKKLTQELARQEEANKASTLLNSGSRGGGGNPGELDAYKNAVAAKIRRNLLKPPGLSGNPEAQLEIEQILGGNGGEVVNVQIRKSSGNRALDEAILRAIRKSSPLPLPDNRNLFDRKLQITFRPLEE